MANENNAQAEKKEKKPSRVAKYLKLSLIHISEPTRPY